MAKKKKPSYSFLFLDRDGVINTRLPGQYVKMEEEFTFMPGVLNSFPRIAKKVDRIIVVTNQQGVGKELMSYEDLEAVHQYMTSKIEAADAIFSCTELAEEKTNCRKPSPAMGMWAKMKFPEIDFSRSLMVGDSASDILFGQNLGMHTVLMEGKEEDKEALLKLRPDYSIKKFSKIVDILYHRISKKCKLHPKYPIFGISLLLIVDSTKGYE